MNKKSYSFQYHKADNIFYQIAISRTESVRDEDGAFVHFEEFEECVNRYEAVRLACLLLASYEEGLIKTKEKSFKNDSDFISIKAALLDKRGRGDIELFRLKHGKFQWDGSKKELAFLLLMAINDIYVSFDSKGYYIRKKERMDSVCYTDENGEEVKKCGVLEKRHALSKKSKDELSPDEAKMLKQEKLKPKYWQYRRHGEIRKIIGSYFGVDNIRDSVKSALNEDYYPKKLTQLYNIQERAEEYMAKYDRIKKLYYKLYQLLDKYGENEEKLYEIVNFMKNELPKPVED